MYVHQGSALSPLLFNLVMEPTANIPHLINIQKKTPKDLLYADDVVLIRDNHAALEGSLERWSTALESTGLKISRNKTEHMQCCYSAANQP